MKMFLLQSITLLAIFLHSIANCQIYTIDQSNVRSAFIYYSAVNLAPLGQEFTPSLPSLNFVELALDDFDDLPEPGELTVSIHSDSITGSLLATSSILLIGPSDGQMARFLFPTEVAVVPGNTYAIKVNVLSGGNWYAACSFNAYPGGGMISEGQVLPTQDLIFSEGTIVPEPSIGTLAALGLSTLLSRWARERRRRAP